MIALMALDSIFGWASAIVRNHYRSDLTELKTKLANYMSQHTEFAEQLQQAVQNKDSHLVNSLINSSPFGGQIQALNNQAKDYQNKYKEAKQSEKESKEALNEAEKKNEQFESHLNETFNWDAHNKRDEAEEAGGKAESKIKSYGESVNRFVNGSASAGYAATAQRLRNREIPSSHGNLIQGAAVKNKN